MVEARQEDEDVDPEPIAPLLRNLKILIVDDDHEGRDLVRAVLMQSGAEVLPAESAEAAQEILSKVTPDVIITDIAMPEMDGFEFARRLRANEQTKSTKIIALSAFPPSANASNEAGFDAYLVKPIDPADLVLSINTVFKR